MSANRLKLNTDKIALGWIKVRSSFVSNRPSLQLGVDPVTASEHARSSARRHIVRPQCGQARRYCLFAMLPLASAAEESRTFIR